MYKYDMTRGTKKLTPQQREEAVKRYIAGESSRSLAKEYRVSYVNILNLVKHRGGDVKGRSKLTKKQWEEIAARYQKGEKPAAIAKDFGIKGTTVIDISRKKGIPIRGIWETRGRYSLNHDAFSKPTPEALYWAGFLMADGSINDKKNSVSLALATKDLSHIEKFKNFVGAQHKITTIPPKKMKTGYTSTGAYTIAFTSQKMIQDLANWGITPRKSHTAVIIGGIEESRDFFRGLIDGDGTVSTHTVEGRNYPSIRLVGSKYIVQQFLNFVKKLNPKCEAKIRKGIGIYIFSTHGRFALKTIEFLYKDSCVALDRKYKKAIDLVHQGHVW